MTCREKLMMEHPENIDPKAGGGCVDCPSTYGYLDDPKWCGRYNKSCCVCWDREIPEKKEEESIEAIGCSMRTESSKSSMDYLMDFVDKVLASKDHQIGIFWTPDGNTSLSIKPWPGPED